MGERGPELLNLPRGSQVIEHNRSMSMLSRGTSGGVSVYQPIYNDFNGAVMTEDLIRMMDEKARAAHDGAVRSAGMAVPSIVNDARARRIIA